MTDASPQDIERLLSDPASAAQAPADVALAAVEAARAKSLPQALWALSDHPTREVAKAARRALHLLRSRGVEVGERPGATAPKPSFAEPAGAPEPCRITAPDGFGDRALWVPLKRAVGFDLFELILSDEKGVVEGHRVELSRKLLRAHFASLADHATEIHELPQERAAALVAEALALGGDPGALPAAKELLERVGGGDPAKALPTSATAPAPADDAQQLAESATLFDEPELATYVPPEAVLRELGLKLDEAEVSPLLLDERQKSDRRRQLIDQTVERCFAAESRARYARRLFELSDLWAAHGRPGPAARAAAAARHLAGPAPILDNPFARRLVQRVFERLEPVPEAPKPAEPAPSGLILPGR